MDTSSLAESSLVAVAPTVLAVSQLPFFDLALPAAAATDVEAEATTLAGSAGEAALSALSLDLLLLPSLPLLPASALSWSQ